MGTTIVFGLTAAAGCMANHSACPTWCTVQGPGALEIAYGLPERARGIVAAHDKVYVALAGTEMIQAYDIPSDQIRRLGWSPAEMTFPISTGDGVMFGSGAASGALHNRTFVAWTATEPFGGLQHEFRARGRPELATQDVVIAIDGAQAGEILAYDRLNGTLLGSHPMDATHATPGAWVGIGEDGGRFFIVQFDFGETYSLWEVSSRLEHVHRLWTFTEQHSVVSMGVAHDTLLLVTSGGWKAYSISQLQPVDLGGSADIQEIDSASGWMAIGTGTGLALWNTDKRCSVLAFTATNSTITGFGVSDEYLVVALDANQSHPLAIMKLARSWPCLA